MLGSNRLNLKMSNETKVKMANVTWLNFFASRQAPNLIVWAVGVAMIALFIPKIPEVLGNVRLNIEALRDTYAIWVYLLGAVVTAGMFHLFLGGIEADPASFIVDDVSATLVNFASIWLIVSIAGREPSDLHWWEDGTGRHVLQACFVHLLAWISFWSAKRLEYRTDLEQERFEAAKKAKADRNEGAESGGTAP